MRAAVSVSTRPRHATRASAARNVPTMTASVADLPAPDGPNSTVVPSSGASNATSNSKSPSRCRARTDSTLSPGAAAADAQQRREVTTVRHNGNGRTVVTQRTVTNRPHAWAKGQRFDRRYAQNYRELDYRQYRGRHLYAPPRGYHWVRSGNDAVLVALTGGVIGAVLAGALR